MTEFEHPMFSKVAAGLNGTSDLTNDTEPIYFVEKS